MIFQKKGSSITRPTQLLIRNITEVSGKKIIVIGAPESAPFFALHEHLVSARLTSFNFDYSFYKLIESDCASICDNIFGSWHKPESLYDSAIIYLPKSDPLIEMVFSMTRKVVEEKGKIYILGENNSGIKSQKPVIEQYFGEVEYSDAARHSVMYRASVTKPGDGKNLEDWKELYSFNFRGESFNVVTLPGVFSFQRLDLGTKLLLDSLDALKAKSVDKLLDWGCGSGVVGLAAVRIFPSAKIDMVDNNALALEASRMTMEVNGMEANIFPTDVFSEVKEKYDLILSNPPFHTGIETNYTMVERFIAEAKHYLSEGGELRIVANTFLRYKPLLEKEFGVCNIILENKSYKVYSVTKR